jgi:type II secretory pathway component PulM
MMSWFEQLSPREKVLIGVMSALVGVLLISLLIIRPIMGFSQNARSNFEYEQNTARLVDSAVANAGQQTNNSAVLSAAELRRQISTEARRAGLRQGGISNNDDDTVTVSFAGVPSGALLAWLGEMEQAKGIAVQEARISKSRTGELVDARLTFRQAKG